jgi:hypothetical protein
MGTSETLTRCKKEPTYRDAYKMLNKIQKNIRKRGKVVRWKRKQENWETMLIDFNWVETRHEQCQRRPIVLLHRLFLLELHSTTGSQSVK